MRPESFVKVEERYFRENFNAAYLQGARNTSGDDPRNHRRVNAPGDSPTRSFCQASLVGMLFLESPPDLCPDSFVQIKQKDFGESLNGGNLERNSGATCHNRSDDERIHHRCQAPCDAFDEASRVSVCHGNIPDHMTGTGVDSSFK